MPISKAVSLYLTVVLLFYTIFPSLMGRGNNARLPAFYPVESPSYGALSSVLKLCLNNCNITFLLKPFQNYSQWFFQQVGLYCTISLINPGYHVALDLQVAYLCKTRDIQNSCFLISESSPKWNLIVTINLASTYFYFGHFLFKMPAISSQGFSPKQWS